MPGRRWNDVAAICPLRRVFNLEKGVSSLDGRSVSIDAGASMLFRMIAAPSSRASGDSDGGGLVQPLGHLRHAGGR